MPSEDEQGLVFLGREPPEAGKFLGDFTPAAVVVPHFGQDFEDRITHELGLPRQLPGAALQVGPRGPKVRPPDTQVFPEPMELHSDPSPGVTWLHLGSQDSLHQELDPGEVFI